MITFKHKGDFKRTEKFMIRSSKLDPRRVMESFGREGVTVLSLATPKDSGLTAASWGYEINVTKTGYSISWTNSNIISGIPVVILIQYGHGTSGGGYVEGRDFINPVIRPIFDKIVENLSKEVSKL